MATDSGRHVQGYAFVHRKDLPAKPGTHCGNGTCEPGENANKCPADCGGGGDDGGDEGASTCYTFLARDARWKTVEPYTVGPTNHVGLDEAFIRQNVALDISKWEDAAGTDILGDEVAGIVDGVDTSSPDTQNEVLFGAIDEDGVIAVTIVWGYFNGPPFARELVEWDMVFDVVDYGWSSSGEADKMDFQNIATHELGHAVGMGDLYTADCSEQTMYGYAVYGETKKRDLGAGDIAGIGALY